MSSICAAGLPSSTTRSACFPTAIESDAVGAAEVGGAVERADFDRLERRQSALDEQFDRALVREAGESHRRRRSGRCRRGAFRRRGRSRPRAGAPWGTASREFDRVFRCVARKRCSNCFAKRGLEHVEAGRHRAAGRERLEDGERGRHRDIALYEFFNQRL